MQRATHPCVQDILPPKAAEALAGMPEVESLLRFILQRRPQDRPSLDALAARQAPARPDVLHAPSHAATWV